MYRYENFEYPETSPDDDGTGSTVYHYGLGRNRPHYWVRDNLILIRSIMNFDEAPPLGEVTPPLPLTPEAPKEKLSNILVVKNVDLHIEENTKKHRTDDFACTSEREVDNDRLPADLVVRRGDSVKITATFDQPYNKEKHNIKLRFSIGEYPVVTKGTLVELEIEVSGTERIPLDEWRATLQDKTGNDVTILVYIPANCVVGKWNFSIIETLKIEKDENGKDKTLIFQYDHMADFTILFNPWCKEDGVYMEAEELLDEYILNESGCLFRGSTFGIDALDWNIGQFQENILESALYLLRRGFKDGVSKLMSDPVMVSRKVAQMVNALDDKGVLVGNWSGGYSGGTSPLKWVGSVKILQQWLKTGRPVKYGQCWVFSGVTTTVCRALGIPCRSVTNFSSAHDTDASICIEEYYRNGEKLHSRDSVWNFHVWNEAWMERPDLVDFPRGWQVIDATPQELSDGVYTCGPCPVLAIRRGEVETPYDAAFIFSEVNADIVKWEKLTDGSLKRLEIQKDAVGEMISTKTPTGEPFKNETFGLEGLRFDADTYTEERRLDLTLDYKPKEGSKEERETVHRAHRKVGKDKPKPYEGVMETESIDFRLIHSHKTMIGNDLEVKFTAKNNGEHDRKISDLGITVAPKTYTGETGKAFYRKQFSDTKLKKGEDNVCFKVLLTPEMYLPHLVELANVHIVATATADAVAGEKEQQAWKTHSVQLRRPVLDVKCPKLAKKGDKVSFEVSFTNPLDVELTDCGISMECNGFQSFDDKKLPNIPPKGEYKDTFTLEALRARRHAAMFNFDCKQLKDISGSGTVYIEF